ncbi:hypothetical protein Bbelb_432390 [Branchiostoma belcheri]|nr:hypothetical protein Bbelb_440600 [Branchiostoma belcheri]KAI8479030.1 hypothetical protein Bbelb_432390 [Branchiostoma belcheri]
MGPQVSWREPLPRSDKQERRRREGPRMHRRRREGHTSVTSHLSVRLLRTDREPAGQLLWAGQLHIPTCDVKRGNYWAGTHHGHLETDLGGRAKRQVMCV